MQGKLRRHQLADPSVFTDKVEKLMASGTDAKGKSAKTAGKPARSAPKKKAASPSRRKKASTD
jgi:hypothetical protein